jgi:hypothetical protein
MPCRPNLLRPLLLVALALSAAARSQSAEKPEPFGQIYVYANWQLPERKWVEIACDNEIAAKVKAGRFFVINLPPGRHVLSESDGMPAFVEVRSGEKSYLRLDREIDGQTVMPVLTRMNPDEAEKEISHLAYIDAAKAVSNSVPRKDPRNIPQPQLKTREDLRNPSARP